MIRAHLSRVVFAIVFCLASVNGATSQTTDNAPSAPPNDVILVADRVFLQGNSMLVATGRVEALYGDVRIKAAKITYDRTNERLKIEGPITITQGENVVVLADAGEMDPQFHNGLLTGARMVLDQQLQLAAHQINRVNGRYSQLYKAAVTSCRVCDNGKPPLWQIRARKVIHDQQERQLYFDGAQFRVLDVPVFYLPRLRLPDPTLKRATGFLIPSFRRSSTLGTGVKIPYFIRMGDHRDVTVTPYWSQNSSTLELRYRQAFRTGKIEFNGAASKDSLVSGTTRAYIFGSGEFDLNRDFKLTFDIEATNDDAYLVDYDYSDKDRLDSEIAVTRTRRDEYIRGALVHYHSLRVTEDNATLPTIIGDIEYERRFFPKRFGGELQMSFGAHSHYRYSTSDTDGIDADSIVDGRDVTRLEADVTWRRNWTLSGGLRAGISAGVAIDQINTTQDSTSVSSLTQITPTVGVTLRWPLRKSTARGVTHILEPMVMLGWSGGTTSNIANDESTRVEFDEGNLLSLSRYPAADRRERGAALAYGVSWTRFAPTGWQSSLTFGQVVRETADANFTQTSGLSGRFSDLLVAGQLKSADGLSLTARALFDTGFVLSKAEARAGWQTSKFAIGASYVWLGTDLAEDRTDTVSEWSVDGLYRINNNWSGSANVRYDVASNTAAEAGIGLQYRNECVRVDLSLSRRFTSSLILTPSTDFSFTIGLEGFSAKSGGKTYQRTCKN